MRNRKNIWVTATDYLCTYGNPKRKPGSEIDKNYRGDKNVVFCEKNKCWSVERKVKGDIDENGLFTPHPNQSVTYTIQFHND